ncbi:MAG: hypothetical protein ACRYFX_25705 [Janthinobacterium lividum]
MLTELLRRDVAGQVSKAPRFLGLIEHACTEASALLQDVLYKTCPLVQRQALSGIVAALVDNVRVIEISSQL